MSRIQIETLGVLPVRRIVLSPILTSTALTAPVRAPAPVETVATAPVRLPEIAPRAPGPSVPSGSTFEPRIPLPAPPPRQEPTIPSRTQLPAPMPVPTAAGTEEVTATSQIIERAPVVGVPIKAPIVGIPSKGGGGIGFKAKPKPAPEEELVAVASEATAAPAPRSKVPFVIGGVLILGGAAWWFWGRKV